MRKLAVSALCVLLLATGCGAGGEQTTVRVFAAASLTESFSALERRFEADHPGVDVQLVLDASSTLAQQLGEGARADVFASADEPNMAKVVREGRIEGSPTVFATNRLTIAVEPGNPLGITGLADLATDGLILVVCAPQVPCGAAAEQTSRGAGVELTPASEEPNVKAVLTKVVTGEADAGLVYVTDALAAGDKVDRVDFPESEAVINDYPIAVLADASQAELARQFTELVLSQDGQRVLKQAGFGSP